MREGNSQRKRTGVPMMSVRNVNGGLVARTLSRGNGDKLNNMVEASPATAIFVVNAQRGGQLVRAGYADAAKVFDVGFCNAFAHTDVHSFLTEYDIDYRSHSLKL